MRATPFRLGMAASVALLASAVAAQADNMGGFYGNTVVCTYANGNVTKVYTEAGGQYSVFRGGQMVAGTWSDDGTNVCYTETSPVPPAGTKPICVASKPWRVGDSWQVTDPTGATCNAVLTAGHQ